MKFKIKNSKWKELKYFLLRLRLEHYDYFHVSFYDLVSIQRFSDTNFDVEKFKNLHFVNVEFI